MNVGHRLPLAVLSDTAHAVTAVAAGYAESPTLAEDLQKCTAISIAMMDFDFDCDDVSMERSQHCAFFEALEKRCFVVSVMLRKSSDVAFALLFTVFC